MDIEKIELSTIDYEKIKEQQKNFKTIFDYNKDISKTAYLNWRLRVANSDCDQYITMGDAFLDAAYNIIQQCNYDNTDKKADSLIFPILFNIVHGIELYLKAINTSLSNVLKTKRSIVAGKHDIQSLCGESKYLINKFKKATGSSNADNMLMSIKYITKFTNNIYEKTNDMTFARYPINAKGEEHYYLKNINDNSGCDQNEVIDIELLQTQIKYIYNLLAFIYESSENKNIR